MQMGFNMKIKIAVHYLKTTI